LPGEPAGAYVRFLHYLNLGPGRSLAAAYSVYRGEAAEGTKRHQVPGKWRADSSRWQWCRRAAAWDAANLTETGRKTVICFAAALESLARTTMEAWSNPELTPSTFKEAVLLLQVVGSFISADAVRALIAQDQAAEAAEPRRRRRGRNPEGLSPPVPVESPLGSPDAIAAPVSGTKLV
jgi:hypothetical protein